ncbi:MAG: restriction endonuclease subunit [Paenibacillaceae bacterium]|jgi:hypothetical protein|nr:restriction endonuclease subunit [Paenibacillaceae bacterium]
MKRSSIMLDMLESTALMQEHVAVILEAKAREAEQRQYWVYGNMQVHCYPGCEEFHKHSLEQHENIVDVIAGITRMEQGLAKNLNLLLHQEDSADSGGFGDLFAGSAEDDS